MKTKIEKCASGKTIGITEWPDGAIDEMHQYGDEIAILYRIVNGVYFHESYFKTGYITKSKYDALRKKYPDMPESGKAPSLEASMNSAIVDEHKNWKKEFNSHSLNKEVGEKSDNICRSMLAKPQSLDLLGWQAHKKRVLGELSQAKSESLIKKLHSLGVHNMWFVDIELPDGPKVPTIAGGMIVKLPLSKEERRDVFIVVDKAVREFGYDGPFDDYQDYVYLKFD